MTRTSPTTPRTLAVVDCLGTGAHQAELLRQMEIPVRAVAVLLRLPARVDDPIQDWVMEGTARVLAELGALSVEQAEGPAGVATGPVPVVIVVWADPALGPAALEAAEALYEAMRGIAQTATLEDSTAGLRCNVVAGTDATTDDVLLTVRYLCSSTDGFAAGASFDLRPRG